MSMPHGKFAVMHSGELLSAFQKEVEVSKPDRRCFREVMDRLITSRNSNTQLRETILRLENELQRVRESKSTKSDKLLMELLDHVETLRS